MKKIFAVIISLIILSMAVVPFSAAEEIKTVSTYPQKASTGDAIQLVVKLESEVANSAIALTIKFDTEVLKYTGCKSGDVIKEYSMNSVNTDVNDPSNLKITGMIVTGSVNKAGTLATFSFEVLKDYTESPFSFVEEKNMAIAEDGTYFTMANEIKAIDGKEYLDQTITENDTNENAKEELESAKDVLADPNSSEEDKRDAADKIISAISGKEDQSSTNTDVSDIPNDNDDPKPDDPNNDNTTDKPDIKVWIIVGASVIIAAAVIVIITVVVKTKKDNAKKQ